VEPFVGSGALFLNTDYSENLLCDSNADLIDLYALLKAKTTEFIETCERLFTRQNNTQGQYLLLRDEFNKSAPGERRASLFVYLNRHCYNGLCRYNSRGEFNTPAGKYTSPYFPAAEMLAFSQKLQTAELKRQDFRATFAEMRPGDLVYCDPPYVPLSKTASFTSYAKDGFSQTDQEDLALVATKAAERGALVLISNHDTPATRKLYRDACLTVPFLVQRMISCDGENRSKTKELIAVFCRRPFALSSEISFDSVEGDLKAAKNTMRKWLLDNSYEDVAEKIESVMTTWRKQGKRTRRNWWDVLAGDSKGNPQCIEGITFPVLRAARVRKGLNVTPGCLCRNQKEPVPSIAKTARWPGES
jgi:DNA adenine methylase